MEIYAARPFTASPNEKKVRDRGVGNKE